MSIKSIWSRWDFDEWHVPNKSIWDSNQAFLFSLWDSSLLSSNSRWPLSLIVTKYSSTASYWFFLTEIYIKGWEVANKPDYRVIKKHGGGWSCSGCLSWPCRLWLLQQSGSLGTENTRINNNLDYCFSHMFVKHIIYILVPCKAKSLWLS